MTILITILHVMVSVFLILVVLLQTGKGADLAGAFGGGGSQTAFGARGATTLLHKLTTVSAVLFMVTSLVLAILASRPSASVVQDDGTAAAAPADPADTTPAAAPSGEADDALSLPVDEVPGDVPGEDEAPADGGSPGGGGGR